MKLNLVNIIFVVSLLYVSAFIVSCAPISTYHRDTTNEQMATKEWTYNTFQVIDLPKTGTIMHIPITADLDIVQTLVTGTSTGVFEKKEPSKSDLQLVKDNAIADALANSSHIVLIAPVFEIKITTEEKAGVDARSFDESWPGSSSSSEIRTTRSKVEVVTTVTVNVKGFPASYKNIRHLTEDDIKKLKLLKD
jgi:hypothetical protein